MRIPTILLVVLVAGLAIAPPAAGKRVSRVDLCGSDGCERLRGGPRELEALVGAGTTSGPPARPAPWYSLRFTVSPSDGEDFEPHAFRVDYVPSARRLRVRGEGGRFDWWSVDARHAALLRRAARGRAPLPAARLRGLSPPDAGDNVREVFMPAAGAARVGGSGGGTPWSGLGVALGGAVAAGALLARRRRSAATG